MVGVLTDQVDPAGRPYAHTWEHSRNGPRTRGAQFLLLAVGVAVPGYGTTMLGSVDRSGGRPGRWLAAVLVLAACGGTATPDSTGGVAIRSALAARHRGHRCRRRRWPRGPRPRRPARSPMPQPVPSATRSRHPDRCATAGPSRPSPLGIPRPASGSWWRLPRGPRPTRRSRSPPVASTVAGRASAPVRPPRWGGRAPARSPTGAAGTEPRRPGSSPSARPRRGTARRSSSSATDRTPGCAACTGRCAPVTVGAPLRAPPRTTTSCTAPRAAGVEDEYLPSITGAYVHAAVIGANNEPDVSGDQPGETPFAAAIFLHRHADDGTTPKPTSGCVSLALDDLVATLALLDPSTSPRFAIGPTEWLRATA